MKNVTKMLLNKKGLVKRVLIAGGVFVGMALANGLTTSDEDELEDEYTCDEATDGGIIETEITTEEPEVNAEA